MSNKGFAGRALDLAHHAVAIKNIIKAFLQGGWASAALQALKYYWPQILAIAGVLLLLPIIIYCCIPMMLFGYDGSTNSQITEMTLKAEEVEEYFNNYDQYCEDRKNEINTEIEYYQNLGYTVVQVGDYMPRNWFIALFSVSVRNNLTNVTEQQIVDFMDNCIVYEVETPVNDSVESENTEAEMVSNTVTIKCLTADETMEYINYSDSDKNWATLIFNTLEQGETDGYNSTYTN